MTDPSRPQPHPPFKSLALIGMVIAAGAGLFAYAAGWFSPRRLTPEKLVGSLAPAGGPALGYRRNHAKGICFTGVFQSNGKGAELSKAQVFTAGEYRALGRFNLGTADPHAADAMVRIRGMGLQFSTPDGDVWRMAMINAPVFPVSTPNGFYALQKAAHSKDPDAIKQFAAAHAEFAAFGQWAKTAPYTASYAEDAFNGLDSFIFASGAGVEHPVRWSLLPEAKVIPITDADLKALGPNHLESEIAERVGKEPQRWRLLLTVAEPGDPTNDPSKAWPESRRTVDAGTLVVEQVEEERDGPCRDINFDPTILPAGIHLSDDPFPPARSSAYAVSYDRRTSEVKYYPYHLPESASAKQ